MGKRRRLSLLLLTFVFFSSSSSCCLLSAEASGDADDASAYRSGSFSVSTAEVSISSKEPLVRSLEPIAVVEGIYSSSSSSSSSSFGGHSFVRRSGLISAAHWLVLSLSDVYAVASCGSNERNFNFCVNEGDNLAELGDCRTKHVQASRTRRLIVALKGTELCNRKPLFDTMSLLLFGSSGSSFSSSSVGNTEGKAKAQCFIPISPFRSYNATVQVSSRGRLSCSISTEDSLSAFRTAAVASGFILIVLAPMLSTSLSFRVGVSASLAVIMGVLLAIYYLMKRPRTTVVSSVLFAIAAMNQSWWRSFLSETNFSKVVILYCAVAACGGAAISFYYDSALSSNKATSIISTCFQVVGTFLIFFNSHSVVLTAALLSVAVAKVLWIRLPSRISKVEEVLERETPAEVAHVKSSHGPSSPRPKKRRPFSPFQAEKGLAPVTPKQSPGSSPPQVAHCVSQGMIMNEETNRLITIGKGTYNKLVKDGWVVDKKIGVISPRKRK